MAITELILQGFTTRTHLTVLCELFAIPEIARISISVAYVKESGVEKIESQLKAHAKNITVFAGVRNDGTSYQGLARLRRIRGITLYTVDPGSRYVVFHPKLYLARGRTAARVLVGSANLTLGGLNNNIEASVVIDLDSANSADAALFDSIEANMAALPAEYPAHVVKITTIRQLDDMLRAGRLVDEQAVSPPRSTSSGGGSSGTNDAVPRIKLKVPPLSRAFRPARRSPRRTRRPITGKRRRGEFKQLPRVIGAEFESVWESAPLTRRDLTIPEGATSNQTGSINMDKGRLPDGVDFRDYFRNTVFGNLEWRTRSATVDEASAEFQLVLKGVRRGAFDLAIRHTTSTTSTSYKQGNAMTRLSWGPAREFVRRTDLIGRTLALYRDSVDPTRFLLEID